MEIYNLSITARLDGFASLAMTNRWRRHEILLSALQFRQLISCPRNLEAVAHVGQGAADDDAHRIGEIAVFHLVHDRDGLDVAGVVRLFGLVAQRGARVRESLLAI